MVPFSFTRRKAWSLASFTPPSQTDLPPSQVNPDARVFRSNSLQFPEDMVTLFGGRATTGSAAWAPSSMSLPDDTSQQSLESHTPSLGEYNTSVDTQHDGGDDIGLEERMNDLRCKGPCLSQNRKETRGDALKSDIQHVITNLEEARKSTTPSIVECFESLNAIAEIEDRSKLYIDALNCFRYENEDVVNDADHDTIIVAPGINEVGLGGQMEMSMLRDRIADALFQS
ncbi:hypothetical protein HHK36_003327 [Tetracentron sinense]|uniref:Uncharacterized protein n=1 Tax=Tetracentron sinense TaxID=13715 RepID=A0A834ZSB2_TETSI|nr:hypothetical protein HHK36_003327 [Tetracentron sinense]